MRFSQTTIYAIQAALHLAASDRSVPVPCRQLASHGKMPERFLLQVLRKLVQRGVLRSTCGVAGGYCLSAPPDEISLGDIVEVFDDSLERSTTLLEGVPQRARERVVQHLNKLSQACRAEWRKLKLVELLEN